MAYSHAWHSRVMTQAYVTRLIQMCAGGWALFVPSPMWNTMQASRNDHTQHWYIIVINAHTHTRSLCFTHALHPPSWNNHTNHLRHWYTCTHTHTLTSTWAHTHMHVTQGQLIEHRRSPFVVSNVRPNIQGPWGKRFIFTEFFCPRAPTIQEKP